mmetsp:Transcript_22591/g.48239  ORF Transcript_22591/g.48239 Transcript_22591/m.48239 type:complete len:155 (+) Transcript_22591:26-490(+)
MREVCKGPNLHKPLQMVALPESRSKDETFWRNDDNDAGREKTRAGQPVRRVRFMVEDLDDSVTPEVGGQDKAANDEAEDHSFLIAQQPLTCHAKETPVGAGGEALGRRRRQRKDPGRFCSNACASPVLMARMAMFQETAQAAIKVEFSGSTAGP